MLTNWNDLKNKLKHFEEPVNIQSAKEKIYHKRYSFEKHRMIKGPRLIVGTWLIWLWVETPLEKPVDS